MAFDRGAYKEAVLKPARLAGNVPPPDLVVRYALTPSDLRVEDAFAARVAEVSGYWRSLAAGNNQLYKKLVQALLAAHAELDRRAELNPAAFRKQREAAVTAARTRLKQRANSIVNSLPCITATTLQRLIEEAAGLLDEAEVRELLHKAGVTVIDPPWQIPAAPPLPAARALAGHLGVLGLRLSIEVVLGSEGMRAGFGVKGSFRTQGNKTIGPSTLEQARKELASRPLDERKTAQDNVLTLLALAIGAPGKLDELLVWELAGILRPEVRAGLPVRAVADTAAELGLDPAEALELAVTLSTAATPDPAATEPDGTELVEELLRTGDLRQAAELAASLPPEAVKPATRERIAAAVQEVEQLLAGADRARSAGDSEEEARLLAQVLTRQADEDLRARLGRIAPPPPTRLSAMADGNRIVLHWRHSEARTGAVNYRVVRSATGAATSPNAQDVVADTDANSAVDARPLVGTPNHYAVFASRGGTAWSAPATAEPVTILPEVATLELDATARSVSGSWRVSPDAVDVEVLRTSPGGGPSTRVALRGGSLDRFVDEAVTTGAHYEYRVRAVYPGPSGDRLATPGVVASIRPQGEPVAVTDLSAELVAGSTPPVIEVRWTEPASGTAELRLASTAPEWAAGAAVPVAAANSYGRPQSGPLDRSADGRHTLRLPVRDGTMFLTVFTSGTRTAVVGNTVRLAVANPVTDLRAVRRGTRVRLGWIWPAGASAVRITWSGETASGQADLYLREYTDDGGFTIDAGTGALDVSVTTLARGTGGPTLSAPVTRSVPARPPQVWWRFTTSRRGGLRRQVVLTLTSDRPCEVPAVVVVRGRGGRPPEDLSSGEHIAELPRMRLSPDTPLVHPLGQERRTGPVQALATFISHDSADLIFGPAQP
jgi:hypothetical protein